MGAQRISLVAWAGEISRLKFSPLISHAHRNIQGSEKKKEKKERERGREKASTDHPALVDLPLLAPSQQPTSLHCKLGCWQWPACEIQNSPCGVLAPRAISRGRRKPPARNAVLSYTRSQGWRLAHPSSTSCARPLDVVGVRVSIPTRRQPWTGSVGRCCPHRAREDRRQGRGSRANGRTGPLGSLFARGIDLPGHDISHSSSKLCESSRMRSPAVIRFGSPASLVATPRTTG